MVDELKETENATPVKGEVPNGSETIGENTMSLFAMTPVVLEPGLIVLEKFKIIDLLGQGGMGSVYRVEHLLMERQFALKCLNKFQSADGNWRRFQNEAKAAHLLDHANLLKVYEFGLLPGGQPFFLMELVEGVTLADEIKRLGQLPVERAVKIFIQVAFAISYAHESHVVHRDIKPSNIMVSRKSDDTETVKVVDFGIAKLTGVDEFNQQTLTKTGEIFGSPLYMSPEQCTGIAVDHRSDLYSLGCVLYETLTGAPPFIGESALSTMMQHQGEKPLSLKEASLGTHYPYILEEIVCKLLEKDPNNRYQTAKALAKDLIQLERRLNEESQNSLPAFDQTQSLKRVECKRPERELMLTVPVMCMLLAGLAVVFAMGALTSFLIIAPGKQGAVERSNRYFEDRNSLNPLHDSKAEKALNPAKGGKQTEDSKNSNDSELAGPNSSNGSNSSDASETSQDKTISTLRQLGAPNPEYEEKVAKSKLWSTPNGLKRDYFFPQKEQLGSLLTGGGEKVDAIGKRSIPNDEPIGFVANENLVKNAAYLEKFAPDELTLLDLDCSSIYNPAFFKALGKLSQLKLLNLYDTKIEPSDYPMLTNLKELRYLNLAWTNANLKDLLIYLQPDNLWALDLTGAKQSSELTRNISRFPKLKQLIMCRCHLTDKDMDYLRQSKLITLCVMLNYDLTDKGIAALSSSKTLKRLDLSGLKVTPQCWKSLVKYPCLQKVKMGYMPWDSREKLYFAKQMHKHAPQIQVDFSSNYYQDFTMAVTDIAWINEGNDVHRLPTRVLFTRDRDTNSAKPTQ
ncbi:MAG: protein kinase [Candidatus Melainabacteria bacterium]|nr:protein kinase [Candidatus Melainabacteria bacterium]